MRRLLLIVGFLLVCPGCKDSQNNPNGHESKKPIEAENQGKEPVAKKKQEAPEEWKLSRFSEVEIEKPFREYLLGHPLLMEVAGAKIIRLENGNQVVIAVASTVLKENSANERLRAERVCRAKALASVVGEKEGVQVAHVEQVQEKTVIVLDGEKETETNLSELLQVTRTKVEGITKDMPVVGRWQSKERDVFYLAIGVIVDKKGHAVPHKGFE